MRMSLLSFGEPTAILSIYSFYLLGLFLEAFRNKSNSKQSYVLNFSSVTCDETS